MEQSKKAEVALYLSEMGFHCIPLNGKKSLIKWEEFQRRAPTDTELAEWWARWPNANVGIITGIQITVLDADTPEAEEFLNSGAITRTPWHVKTPRGKHYYFRVSESLKLTNAAGNGLDARGIGGYVVGPGSDGYSWEVDLTWGATVPGDLPMLTPQDVAAVNSYRALKAYPTNAMGDAQGPDVLAHLGAIKDPHDGSSVPQGGRNNALASMVGQWINQKMPLSDILAHARVWNASNKPPLPDAELIHTVTSISLGHQKRHNEEIPLGPETNTEPDGLPVFTLDELTNNPPEVPETFWGHGVLFRGARLLIGGAPKVGKSRFFLAMAVAASIGGSFLGRHFEKPLRVMWVQAEIHVSFVHERIKGMMVGVNSEERTLLGKNMIVTGRLDMDLTNPLDRAQIDAAIGKYQPDMVCFDPAINFSTADENKNTDIRSLLRSIDALGAKHNAAMVLVHHTRKDAATAGSTASGASFESIRGASAFRGWYDSGILLGGDSHNTTVNFEFRNTQAMPACIASFNVATGRYEVADLDTFNGVDSEHDSKPSSPSKRRPFTSSNGSQEAGPEKSDEDMDDSPDKPSKLYTRMQYVITMLHDAGGSLMAAEIKQRCEIAFNIKTSVSESILTALTRSGEVTKTRVGFNSVLYTLTTSTDEAKPVDNFDGETA